MVLGIKGGKQGARVITLPLEGGYNQLWTWQGCSLISKTGYALDILWRNRPAMENGER